MFIFSGSIQGTQNVWMFLIMAGQHTPMKGTPMTNKAFITGY